jgi:hypothetical protein
VNPFGYELVDATEMEIHLRRDHAIQHQLAGYYSLLQAHTAGLLGAQPMMNKTNREGCFCWGSGSIFESHESAVYQLTHHEALTFNLFLSLGSFWTSVIMTATEKREWPIMTDIFQMTPHFELYEKLQITMK